MAGSWTVWCGTTDERARWHWRPTRHIDLSQQGRTSTFMSRKDATMSSLLTTRHTRGTLAAFLSSALALTGAAALLGSQPSSASSHREAPQLLSDPQVDNTDVY